MNAQPTNSLQVRAELKALQGQVLSLAGIVESVLAEAIVALVEGDFGAAREVRLEDYKAHKVWLQTDSLCVEILASGQLRLEEVRFVAGAIKMAMHLKRMADEAVRISRHMSACPHRGLPPGPCTEVLPRMAEITQGIFTSSVESLANPDAPGAEDLQPVARELSSLKEELVRQVNEELTGGRLPAEVGTALVLVGRCLEEIAQLALEVASLGLCLHPTRGEAGRPEGEAQ